MNALLRRRLDMATRVREFLKAHQDVVGDGAGAAGLARLDGLIQRADELVARQRAGIAMTRAATLQRSGILDTLQTALLRYLQAVSQAAAKENSELVAQFQMPHNNISHRVFVTAVRGMLTKATEQKDLLVSHGMQPSLLDDLGAAVTGFEQTLEASREGRRQHVGARSELEAIEAEILVQVRVLDGLMRYRFKNNAELMGEWASARNVLGPFRQKAQPQAPADGSQTPKAA